LGLKVICNICEIYAEKYYLVYFKKFFSYKELMDMYSEKECMPTGQAELETESGHESSRTLNS
jgi:transcription elongation factor Elf1